MAAAGDVRVDVGAAGVAHVCEVKRCGSPWACPCCSPVVRERKARDIDQGVGGHLAAGGGVVFVTLTVRHALADELGPRLAAVAGSLGRVLSGNPWKRRARRWGYLGAIKAVETPHGVNGWHPHSHSLLIFERPLTVDELGELHGWLFSRWDGICRRLGFGTLSAAHGVDVRAVREAGELAGYLAKVDGGWGAGLELARSDLKRGTGSRTPFAILEEFAVTGDLAELELWQEYEAATFGKRAIVWSPGLRGRLLGDEVELSDEELAAAEAEGETLYRALVGADEWNVAVVAGDVGGLLDRIEVRGRWLIDSGTCGPGSMYVERFSAAPGGARWAA